MQLKNRSKAFSQEFSCILSDLDLQLEQSKHENPAREKIGSSLLDMMSHIQFLFKIGRLILAYGPVLGTRVGKSSAWATIVLVFSTIQGKTMVWPFQAKLFCRWTRTVLQKFFCRLIPAFSGKFFCRRI